MNQQRAIDHSDQSAIVGVETPDVGLRMAATIDQRILVTFRADPEPLKAGLPEGFRLRIVDGSAVTGLCILGLSAVRPAGLPTFIGVSSWNVAHRIAVERRIGSDWVPGVFIPMRHTSSRLTVAATKHVLRSSHRKAAFQRREVDGEITIDIVAPDVDVHVRGKRAERFDSTLFGSLDDCSMFYRAPFGWSPGRRGALDQVSLVPDQWKVEPFELSEARTAGVEGAFDLSARLDQLDSALIMTGLSARLTLPR